MAAISPERGIKLVRRPLGLGGLVSLDVSNSIAEVEYLPEVWTIPKQNCGPLTVFNKTADALRFLNRYATPREIEGGLYQLWKCIWIPSTEMSVYYPAFWPTVKSVYPNEHRRFLSDNLPVGTRLATAVMIGKRFAFQYNAKGTL